MNTLHCITQSDVTFLAHDRLETKAFVGENRFLLALHSAKIPDVVKQHFGAKDGVVGLLNTFSCAFYVFNDQRTWINMTRTLNINIYIRRVQSLWNVKVFS